MRSRNTNKNGNGEPVGRDKGKMDKKGDLGRKGGDGRICRKRKKKRKKH